jgi:hypothetical protein
MYFVDNHGTFAHFPKTFSKTAAILSTPSSISSCWNECQHEIVSRIRTLGESKMKPLHEPLQVSMQFESIQFLVHLLGSWWSFSPSPAKVHNTIQVSKVPLKVNH